MTKPDLKLLNFLVVLAADDGVRARFDNPSDDPNDVDKNRNIEMDKLHLSKKAKNSINARSGTALSNQLAINLQSGVVLKRSMKWAKTGKKR